MDKLVKFLKDKLSQDPQEFLNNAKPLIEIKIIPTSEIITYLDIIHEDTYKEYVAKNPILEYAIECLN